MEINVSPKAQFLALDQLSAEFRTIVIRDSVQTAATYAVAEMNFKGKFNSEQMQAVNDFVRIFFNLGERPPEIKKYPSKSLNYAAEKPRSNRPKTETL